VNVVLLDMTPLEADLTYLEHPVKILDQNDCVTTRKMIKFFNVQWSNHTKKRPCGRVKTSSIRAIRTLSYRSEDTCDYLLSLLGSSPFKSRVEIYY
jgi:hypothetical protein